MGFWPPSGIAVAAVLMLGTPALAPVFVGSLLATLILLKYPAGQTTIIALACAVGEVFGASLGARLARTGARERDFPLSTAPEVMRFAGIAAPSAAILSSAMTLAGLALARVIPEPATLSTWLRVGLGNYAGIIVFTPLCLVWTVRRYRQIDWSFTRRVEAGMMILSCALLSSLTFFGLVSLSAPYYVLLSLSIFPLLLLAGHRFLMHGATSSMALVTIIAVAGSQRMRSPLATGDISSTVGILHAFIVLVATSLLGHTAQLLETLRANYSLQNIRLELEKQVQERTRELSEEVKVRTAAEDAMRRERDFINLLLDSTGSAIVLLDTDDRIVRFNPAAERLSGYAAHEVMGRRPAEILLCPESTSSTLHELKRSKTSPGRSYESPFENCWLTKEGTRRWITWSGGAVFGPDGKPLYYAGMGIDITARKEAEEKLAHSMARHQAIVNSVEGIVWEADAKTFRFLYVSKKAAKLLGYPAEEWISNPHFWESHIHPDDRKWARAFCHDSSRTGGPYEFEYRMIAADGRTVWLQDWVTVRMKNGSPDKLSGIMVDITARKRLESALRQSHDQLTLALESAGMGAWHWDLASNELHWMGKTTEILGVKDHDEPKSMEEFSRLVHPEDQEQFRRTLEDNIQHGGDWQMDYRIQRREAPPTWIRARGHSTKDRTGKTTTVAGVLTDITQQKRFEQERARLLEQTQRAVRAREEFISVASHELKTPLTPLKLQLEVLRQTFLNQSLKELSQDRLRKMLDISDKQLSRLVDLVNTLLDVSRLRSGRLKLSPRSVDLGAVVRDSVERLHADFIGSRTPVYTRIDEGVVGHWDELRIGQIVTNLLSNAIKYGRHQAVTITVKQERDSAILEVRDEGIGIRKLDQARIFGSFERAVPPAQFAGFGLGLFITQQIVEAHGGTIGVESEPGRGSTFTVNLPLRIPAEMPQAA